MIGPNFMDEIDCGSFFDHIDDLLDFPADDSTNGLSGKDCNAFPSIWTNPPEGPPGGDSVFSGNSCSDLSAELSVPYEDMLQLEWLSNFVEDSFSGGCATAFEKQNSSFKQKDSASGLFQTSSPVSVLESSSSSSGSGGKTRPPSPDDPNVLPRAKPGRARSKRPRPPAFNRRPPFQLLSPATSSSEAPQAQPVPDASSGPEGFAEAHPPKKRPGATDQKKRKKIKLLEPSAAAEDAGQNPPAQSVRKCQHCEITKTPQWRAGPTGPKTLCNACGVRFKSGRLFPEYRPAASPTFVPSLHSNSHRKVLEMRGKVVEASPLAAASGTALAVNVTAATEPEFVPISDALADRM